ncbi:radial spoke head protein 3 homolog [Corythoichthys intestinalis]|uniref:radial spoke head protein 3 homolog n=1 Tax=Corythoichthys intestinalis TaxID=161448 RepID=UPI0025A68CCE|nr:radial spoke head protein 3 homolog [Corythoichthys intestinalis]XP_061800502.1 radial spoke head protein 3 homolog [Nerophis lumbriciformis]
MASVSQAQGNKNPSSTYVYSSRPRPVDGPCAEKPQYGNIMYDRRVIRGNAAKTAAQAADVLQQHGFRRRSVDFLRSRDQLWFKTRGDHNNLPGRKHVDVQTDSYLEELSLALVTKDADSQTDPFLDRPATPLFIPAKSGEDVATQILEGELFDFDREVQPVLEVLVGKTIEQSLLEVMEEEELACLRAQQRAFQQLRNAELAEVQRLQEQERRRAEEKECRIGQQKEAVRKEKETAEMIAAQACAQQFLSKLFPAVFASLRRHGYFYDPVERDIEINFFQWLMAEVNNTLEKRNSARLLLDTIIHDIALARRDFFGADLEEQAPKADK